MENGRPLVKNKRQRMKCGVPGNLRAAGAEPHLCPRGKQEEGLTIERERAKRRDGGSLCIGCF